MILNDLVSLMKGFSGKFTGRLKKMENGSRDTTSNSINFILDTITDITKNKIKIG